MKVIWKKFNEAGYLYATEHYPDEARMQDFETTISGVVLHADRTFWGTPIFIVMLDDKSITTVKVVECKVIEI